MPDLEMLLRDVRPVPDPVWVEQLDRRVAARFGILPPRWRRAVDALRENLFALGSTVAIGAAALVLVLVIANADFSGSDSDEGGSMSVATSGSAKSADSSGGAGGSAPDSAKSDGGSGGSAKSPGGAREVTPTSADGSSGSSGAAAPLAQVQPQASTQARPVKKTTAITLMTAFDDVQSVSDKAIQVVDNLGGYVDSSSTDITSRRAEASLSLRIPSAKLDDGLARLSKLADVTSRSQETQDLTDQRAYLEARVRDARADQNGLRARLRKATTDKERASLRAQLDRATRTVTRRERDVAALGQEAAYGTVDLTIKGKKKPAGAAPVKPGDRWTPGDALRDAGRVLEVIAGVLLIGLAIVLPIALLAALAWLAHRATIRRRRLRALELA